MISILTILTILFYIAISDSLLNSELGYKTEEAFINDIKIFLQYEEGVLSKLKEFKHYIGIIHSKATEDESYLQNSVNDFLIVKRIVMDWQFMIALASLNKHVFLKELQENVSNITQHPGFPDISNLTNIVLKIAEAQEKQGINSVSEFVATLTNDPYTKLAVVASECSLFATVLKAVNKDTLAKSWEMESTALAALFKDPLMEIQDFPFLIQRLHTIKKAFRYHLNEYFDLTGNKDKGHHINIGIRFENVTKSACQAQAIFFKRISF